MRLKEPNADRLTNVGKTDFVSPCLGRREAELGRRCILFRHFCFTIGPSDFHFNTGWRAFRNVHDVKGALRDVVFRQDFLEALQVADTMLIQ